jgi:dihydrofolate reductase
LHLTFLVFLQAPKQDPIERFGVVAAMSKNRVIGVNGQIPWRLPEDRKIFKRLTKDGILIVGRRTFEEEPGQRHINHARHCIVISKSIDRVDDKNIDGSDRLRLAGSLDEALHQAKELVETLESHDGGLKCWVAGGERLYEEAIRHSSAQEIHLSVVDTDVDLTGGVVRFPAKHRWDQKFLESSQEEYLPMGDAPRFTYFVYRRRGSN